MTAGEAEQQEQRRQAESWLWADPDPDTRAELQGLLSGDGAELSRRFGGRLSFGTAGIRGPMGAGPTRMNRVLVRIVASALAERVLQEREAQPHVVVGYDARHGSADFATDTARVLAARGVPVTMLAEPMPTPVLAFAVKHLEASAGVMVTASHNPRHDNGYKVFWRGGAQLAAPIDAQVSELIDHTAPPAESDLAPADHPLITVADASLADAYLDTVAAMLAPDGHRCVRIAYTPLHGVGAKTFLRAVERAGFGEPAVVAEQAEPDPDFPTAPFPNPEETGVLDLLLQLAAQTDADMAIAHDPDADRLAVAVPANERWRLLTGDETGCLLAEHLLARRSREHRAAATGSRRGLVINTVVSSRLLQRIAADHGADHAETLTGFKWIMKARSQRAAGHDLVLGYEDALGYAVGDAVADKDGISAALVMAELVAGLAAEGRTVSDLLDDIHRRHGVHVTGQRSIRFESVPEPPPLRARTMTVLRQSPPAELGGAPVTAVEDLAAGLGHLPGADVMVLEVAQAGGRVIVRPSGTEPKIKVYAETVVSAGDGDGALRSARARARTQLAALLDDAVRYVAEVERRSPIRGGALGGTTADRAARLAAHSPSGASREDDLRLVVRCTDLTTLEGDDTPGRIRALCSQALRPDPADPTVGPVAAVCVHPALAGLAAELLAGTPVAVASVAGAFPSGLSPLEVKTAEVNAAVAAGAQEIDTVLNRAAFLSGRDDLAAEELRALRRAAGPAHFKVILEVCELGSLEAVAAATRLAIGAGADMVKTSTGKGAAGASPEAVLVMAETVGEHRAAGGSPVGIKVAGGVRTAADALGYLNIVRSALGSEWLTPERLRFGASSLLGDVVATLAAG